MVVGMFACQFVTVKPRKQSSFELRVALVQLPLEVRGKK
jgi:hypothetical protein